LGLGHIKIFFSRTTGPILTRLNKNFVRGRGFTFALMKGVAHLQGEIIQKELKNTEFFFKNLLQAHWAKFNQTWFKISLGEGDSSLL
jgi:hypothetical protein